MVFCSQFAVHRLGLLGLQPKECIQPNYEMIEAHHRPRRRLRRVGAIQGLPQDRRSPQAQDSFRNELHVFSRSRSVLRSRGGMSVGPVLSLDRFCSRSFVDLTRHREGRGWTADGVEFKRGDARSRDLRRHHQHRAVGVVDDLAGDVAHHVVGQGPAGRLRGEIR